MFVYATILIENKILLQKRDVVEILQYGAFSSDTGMCLFLLLLVGIKLKWFFVVIYEMFKESPARNHFDLKYNKNPRKKRCVLKQERKKKDQILTKYNIHTEN